MKKKAAKKTPKKKKSTKKPVRRAAVKSKTKTKTKRTVKKAAKKAVQKTAKKTQAPSIPKSGVIAPKGGLLLGYVEDYFAKVGVIALTLEQNAMVNRRIQVLGYTTNFDQALDSMQINHEPVSAAVTGQGVGIKVIKRARRGDHVYLLP